MGCKGTRIIFILHKDYFGFSPWEMEQNLRRDFYEGGRGRLDIFFKMYKKGRQDWLMLIMFQLEKYYISKVKDRGLICLVLCFSLSDTNGCKLRYFSSDSEDLVSKETFYPIKNYCFCKENLLSVSIVSNSKLMLSLITKLTRRFVLLANVTVILRFLRMLQSGKFILKYIIK